LQNKGHAFSFAQLSRLSSTDCPLINKPNAYPTPYKPLSPDHIRKVYVPNKLNTGKDGLQPNQVSTYSVS